MNSQLIVHQPYRTLLAFQDEFGLTHEEMSLAWTVINDHYMTDLPLLHPPHIVALTAILMALVLRPVSNTTGGPTGSNTSTGAAGAGAGGGGGGAGGVALAATALAQAQLQAQARVAAVFAGGGGGGNAPGTPGFTSSQGSQMGSAQGENLGEPKKATDPRLAKVQRFAMWLAESSIDIEAMVDCTQELISFYECHEQYNDKHTREQISRFIKARGLDK
jgi:cyclin C